MSGCGCGQTIVTSAPAVARVDVEPVLMCDLLADGTVAAQVLVEPVYDTSTGLRIATRLVDPTTGDAYTPVGTLGPCQPEGCTQQVTQTTRCDDTDGDGIGDVTYVELWSVDPCQGGDPVLLGAYRDGNLTQPYTPVSPVACTQPECVTCAEHVLCDVQPGVTSPIGPIPPMPALGSTLPNGVTWSRRGLDPSLPTSRRFIVDAGAPDVFEFSEPVELEWAVGFSGPGDGAIVIPPGNTLTSKTADITWDPVTRVLSSTASTTTAGIARFRADNVTTFTAPVRTATPSSPTSNARYGDFDVTVPVSHTFLRTICRDCSGAVISLTDTELDGTTPYTTVGTVGACEPVTEDLQRYDGEVVPLCDVAADGTVVEFLRHFTYGTLDGVVYRRKDTTLDGITGYTPTGTVGRCPERTACDSPTEPTATVGLCLPDGTPIAVTVVRDCDGVVTQEGWINLRTGAFSAGAPPAGVTACGDSQSVQVSGTFCDVDDTTGDVLGLVLVEYSYAADGTIASVRLVDAVTGTTYTPTGTVTVCPAGVEQPEQDAVTLCDVQADGTSVPMVRDYRRDENGAITGHSDYTLDGAAYTPVGTVGICQPETEPCGDTETLTLCDTAADGTVTTFLRRLTYDCAGAVTDTADTLLDGSTPYTAAGTVGPCECLNCETVTLCDSEAEPVTVTPTATDTSVAASATALGVGHRPLPGGGAALWSGGVLTFPGEATPPADGGDQSQVYRGVGAVLAAVPPECFTGDTVDLTAAVRITRVSGGGFGYTGRVRILTGTATVEEIGLGTGAAGTYTVTGTVPKADLDAGLVTFEVWLETYQGQAEEWTVDQFTATAEFAGCPATFQRTTCRDCAGEIVTVTDTTFAGDPYTVLGEPGPCAGPDPTECLNCETHPMCDAGVPQTVTLGRTLTDTDPTPYFQASDNLWKVPLPGGGQVFWDGGALHWATENTPVPPAQQANGQQHDYIAAKITGQPFVPDCPSVAPPSQVTITASAVIENVGPTTAVQTAALFRLHDGATQLAAGVQANMGTGSVRTITFTHTVSYTQWLSGNLAVELDAEVYTQGAKGWNTREFTLTATATVDACPTTFLRTTCRDCDGAIISTTDALPDGTAYTPTGDVAYGQCTVPVEDVEPCTACETTPLCDIQTGVSAVLPSFGTPIRQWLTLPNGVRWMKRGNDGVLPGGWFVADSGAPERFDFDRPVALRMSVRFSGPTAAPLRIPAGWYLDGLVGVQHSWNAATRTLSPTASVTLAGESTFRIEPQVVQSMQAPVIVGVQPSGQTSQYGQITATADQVTPFLRVVCRDCSGAVTSVTDTAVDGETAYTVLGTAGRCPDADSPECQDCETLVLCDDGVGDPARITGTGASTGTLSNGVTWSARGSSAAAPASYDGGAGEGAWWPAIYSFPNATIGNSTWSFDRPSVVEFSVYMRWVNYSGASDPTNPTPRNATQLPSNVEPVYLPDGYHYDPATHVVSVDELRGPAGAEPCTNLTAPTVTASARFRTTEPVSSITTRYLGVRVANCGVFGSQRVGAFAVTPSGQFLRNVCRECDGSVSSVTDTLLDGVTPYVAAGAVGVCTAVPPCDKSVLSECTYHLPDTITGFDLEPAQFPGCWLGVAQNPTYRYGDRVTSWEATYQSSTGTVSGVGFIVDGAALDVTAFTPAIPANPTQSAPTYVGTATVNGVTVTLSAVAGNGIMTGSATQLMLNPGDRIRVEFSRPVPLVVTTSAFADPPTPHLERLCGVLAETVPWEAVKLADCEGVITTVDATTRQMLPATAVVSCDDDCCQPVQVCVSATTTETIEFISNEEQRDDDTIDTVWTWTNQGDANGPAAAATWYQMYRARYGFAPSAWSVVDSDTDRPAGWISPHPNGATATTGAPGEGPTLSGTPTAPMRWWARAGFSLPAAADPDSIRVQITVLNADQVASRFRLNTGGWTALPANATYNGVPYTFGPGVIPGAQPGVNTLYFEVLETVDNNPGNGAGVMAHFIVTYDVPGIGQRSWTRMVCCDGSVHYLDEFGERQEELPPSAMVIPCGGSAQPMVLCDDNGAFIRHVAYLGDQVITTDTDLNGSTYAPVGPVRSCGA